MNRTTLITLIYLILSAGVIAAICLSRQREQTAVAVVVSDEATTHTIAIYTADIDTMMIGKWQHTIDTTWYRVYTTEPAEDGFCWGREWHESEDIYEDDLTPYGNGWFTWKKDDQAVIEWHRTDLKSTQIPFEYKVIKLRKDLLHIKELRDTEKHQFRKIE